ncbi:PfkB family carbohydrate kinase [Streptomyces sp. MS1.HAVA.3]|uniref:PfkB family carbohydrate kinase n=1 Tax=Streptomyces caledonius TaxID=3134107 RepID=A0ABU8TZX5_9ACTN
MAHPQRRFHPRAPACRILARAADPLQGPHHQRHHRRPVAEQPRRRTGRRAPRARGGRARDVRPQLPLPADRPGRGPGAAGPHRPAHRAAQDLLPGRCPGPRGHLRPAHRRRPLPRARGPYGRGHLGRRPAAAGRRHSGGIPPVPVNPAPVDATGAGDCFTGTATARLVLGDRLADAVAYGAAAASLSVSGRGGTGRVPAFTETAALAAAHRLATGS